MKKMIFDHPVQTMTELFVVVLTIVMVLSIH